MVSKKRVKSAKMLKNKVILKCVFLILDKKYIALEAVQPTLRGMQRNARRTKEVFFFVPP